MAVDLGSIYNEKIKMNTLIVNLARDVERKEYMKNLLSRYPFLNSTFIEAVYGKALPADELARVFDEETAFKRYGRKMNPGEIGCTLSHFKCYRSLLESKAPYVLILEDDITVLRDFAVADEIALSLPSDEPWVLFLSGDFWYKSLKTINVDLSLAKVYDAVGTYAYIINRKGAELVLSNNPRPSQVADHWSLYRRQGLKLYAVKPYMIDANIETFESSVEQQYFGEIRKNMAWKMRLQAYWLSAMKRLLLKRGQFVCKIRKQK